jgi:hypothetical protein
MCKKTLDVYKRILNVSNWKTWHHNPHKQSLKK